MHFLHKCIFFIIPDPHKEVHLDSEEINDPFRKFQNPWPHSSLPANSAIEVRVLYILPTFWSYTTEIILACPICSYFLYSFSNINEDALYWLKM